MGGCRPSCACAVLPLCTEPLTPVTSRSHDAEPWKGKSRGPGSQGQRSAFCVLIKPSSSSRVVDSLPSLDQETKALKDQVRSPLSQSKAAVHWVQDINVASWAHVRLRENVSCFIHSKDNLFCDTLFVTFPLTLFVLCQPARQPKALPSSASLHLGPRPSHGLSSSKCLL